MIQLLNFNLKLQLCIVFLYFVKSRALNTIRVYVNPYENHIDRLPLDMQRFEHDMQIMSNKNAKMATIDTCTY